jgi:hypothetical protein
MGQASLQQRRFEVMVVAVKAVGHDGVKRYTCGPCLLDQAQSDLRFGAKRRVLLYPGQTLLRGVGHHMQRVVALPIGPQDGHGHDAIVDFAHRAQVLARHMLGGAAVLAIPVSSITSTPEPEGAVASSARRLALIASAFQLDSERKNCSRCTSGAWA